MLKLNEMAFFPRTVLDNNSNPISEGTNNFASMLTSLKAVWSKTLQ